MVILSGDEPALPQKQDDSPGLSSDWRWAESETWFKYNDNNIPICDICGEVFKPLNESADRWFHMRPACGLSIIHHIR